MENEIKITNVDKERFASDYDYATDVLLEAGFDVDKGEWEYVVVENKEVYEHLPLAVQEVVNSTRADVVVFNENNDSIEEIRL